MMNVYSRVIAILGFVLFVNLFIFHPLGTVALALIFLGLWSYVIYSFGRKNEVGKGVTKISLGVALLASTVMIFVDGPVRGIMMVLLLITNMMVTAYILMKGDYPKGILETILSPLIDIGEYIRGGFAILRGIITGSGWKVLYEAWRKGRNVNGIKSTLFGVLLGLPIVVILTSLLTQADPVFATFITKLVSKEFVNELQTRLIISAFITLFLIPVIAMRTRSTYRSPLLFLTKLDLRREVTIVMGMVAIVMGVFLVLSWPYVFAHVAKETSLAQYGVATYSEYVQKGFTELLKVVFLILGVSWGGLLVYRGKEQKEHAKWLLTMQGILLFELLIFVISIARRVGLYTQFHGLSLARLYGISILVWLSGMTVFMSSRYLRKGKYALYEVMWTVGIVFITALINFDKLVVNNPPTVNGRVDYVYLSGLSADGVTGWLQAYTWAKGVAKKNTTNDSSQLGAEERREIYYAGMILQTNLSNYHKLLYKYGSEAEIKNYVSKVIESGLLPLNKEQLNKDIDINVYGNAWLSRKGKIEDYSTAVYPVSHFNYVMGKDKERLSGWDKLLGWSGAEQSAWKVLSKDVALEDLLQTIKEVDALRARIDKQPKSERYVEVDISTMSLLLR